MSFFTIACLSSLDVSPCLRYTMTTLIRLHTAAAKDESRTKDAHEVVFMIAIKFSGEEEG